MNTTPKPCNSCGREYVDSDMKWPPHCCHCDAPRDPELVHEMAVAYSTECFWEFLRGNISYDDCQSEIRASGGLVGTLEILAARMGNRACEVTIAGKTAHLVQPY